MIKRIKNTIDNQPFNGYDGFNQPKDLNYPFNEEDFADEDQETLAQILSDIPDDEETFPFDLD